MLTTVPVSAELDVQKEKIANKSILNSSISNSTKTPSRRLHRPSLEFVASNRSAATALLSTSSLSSPSSTQRRLEIIDDTPTKPASTNSYETDCHLRELNKRLSKSANRIQVADSSKVQFENSILRIEDLIPEKLNHKVENGACTENDLFPVATTTATAMTPMLLTDEPTLILSSLELSKSENLASAEPKQQQLPPETVKTALLSVSVLNMTEASFRLTANSFNTRNTSAMVHSTVLTTATNNNNNNNYRQMAPPLPAANDILGY